MSFLEVKNLNISYPTRKETIVASKNVEFKLERGEILGIVVSQVQANQLLQMPL